MPLYKGNGDRTDLRNNQPICLISTISKIAVVVLMEQIVEHMTRNGLWSCEQHAYCSSLSTAPALLTLQEEWLDNMDRNLQILQKMWDNSRIC